MSSRRRGASPRQVRPADMADEDGGELAERKKTKSLAREITRPVREHPEAVSDVLDVVANLLPDVVANLLP